MKNTGIAKQTDPIDRKEKVQKSNYKHIDQDFEGYPHNPAREEVINPRTKEERLTAKTEVHGKITPAKKRVTDMGSMPGEPDRLEDTLANTLGGDGKISGQPNELSRLKKQKTG